MIDQTPEANPAPVEAVNDGPRALRELIERVSGRGLPQPLAAEEAGVLEELHYPFLALVLPGGPRPT